MATDWIMSSWVRQTSSHPGNLFRQLCISSLLITFRGVDGYLTAKPQDAVRSVGQVVTFTCNSSWTDPIHWWFIRDDSADEIVEELGTNAAVHLTLSDLKIVGERGEGSPDGYRSSLTINKVTRWHAGTFRCQDGTGSRGAARLTVTSTPETVCLTVSPRDHVVVAGDSVVLTASSNSSRLRIYYERPADSLQSKKRVELYDGEELNDVNVDERYSVIGVGDKGHADLVIRSVQSHDAGRYIAKDTSKRAYEVAADLVVFDRSPECTQIWHPSEDKEIRLQCYAKYTGQLTPRVSFLLTDVTAKALQKSGNGGTIFFQHEFKFSELTVGDIADSRTFEIGFELSQCGEPVASWSWKHAIPNNIEIPRPTYFLLTTLALIALLTVSVVINVSFIIVHRKIWRTTRDENYKREAACGEYGRLRTTSASSTSTTSTLSTSSIVCHEQKT